MSAHLTASIRESYRRMALAPEELLAADDHLAVCSACRECLSREEPWQALLMELRKSLQAETYHAPDCLLRGCVNDEIDDVDREIVKAHRELRLQCQACLNCFCRWMIFDVGK